MNTTQRTWQPDHTLVRAYQSTNTPTDQLIAQCVRPETALERRIVRDARWREGALWGKPRRGHPEGKVLYHIHEVLKNVDQATDDPIMRERLRLITILHDTFKHLEEQQRPRTDWNQHHAIIARRFAAEYIDDEAILDIIELHDHAYYAWRAHHAGYTQEADSLMQMLLGRIGADLQLYYLFFKCDTQTGDKVQTPIGWVERRLHAQLELVYWD